MALIGNNSIIQENKHVHSFKISRVIPISVDCAANINVSLDYGKLSMSNFVDKRVKLCEGGGIFRMSGISAWLVLLLAKLKVSYSE